MARVLKCGDCGKNPTVVELAPMLYDAVWRELAGGHEMLCAKCMFTRATARDVRLSLASLQPCEFNLMCSPVSWFELFVSIEMRPPENLDAWRAVAARFANAPTALREDAMKMELN
ncbi:MAG TPA: hypothetical protein VI358_10725 [Pseudolabrys sp.]